MSSQLMSYETDNASYLPKPQRSEDILDVNLDRQMEIWITQSMLKQLQGCDSPS